MILRTSDVSRLTGLSRTTLWRMERAGTFPTRIRLGENSVGWLEEDVRAWLQARPRGLADIAGPATRQRPPAA